MVLSEKVYRFISKYESRFIYTVYMHVHVSRVMVEFGIQKKKKIMANFMQHAYAGRNFEW